jgi:hypothetical protein
MRESVKTITVTPQLERFLTSLHHLRDLAANNLNVDRALTFELPTGVVTSYAVVASDHELCVPVDHKIRIMACEDQLPFPLGYPQLLDDSQDHFVVEVILRLVNDERWSWLVQESVQESRGLLAG